MPSTICCTKRSYRYFASIGQTATTCLRLEDSLSEFGAKLSILKRTRNKSRRPGAQAYFLKYLDWDALLLYYSYVTVTTVTFVPRLSGRIAL